MNNPSTNRIKLLLSAYFLALLSLYCLKGWNFGVAPLLGVSIVFCSGAFLFMLGDFSFWRKAVQAWFVYAFFGLSLSILPKLLFIVIGSEQFDALRMILVLIELGLTIYLFFEFRKYDRSLGPNRAEA
jgi:hypothetical protein